MNKTRSLTEAQRARDVAQDLGFNRVVGCEVGSSLAMARATLLAQTASFCDLDGPLLLAHDRDNQLHYDGAGVHPPIAALWG